jgi:hypothetical protein
MSSVSRAAVGAGLCALVAASVAGCGQSDDRMQVRRVVERFDAALARHDGTAACSELSTDTAMKLASDDRRPCPQAILSLGLEPAGPGRLQVFVTSAKVDATSGESFFLGRTPAGWRIAALGCKPPEKPADRPYDCEVEA